MGKAVFIEGKSGSLDFQIYQKLLQPNPAIVLIPAGGKQGIGAYVSGYFAGSRVLGTRDSLIIMDRDFDKEPQGGALIPDGKGRYRTGLPCMESYFLRADLVQAYLAEEKEKTIALADIQASLENAALAIRDYEATRWALQASRQDLQEQAKALGLIQETFHPLILSNRLSSADGILPDKNTDYHAEALKVITAFRGFENALSKLSVDFEKHFQRFGTFFQQADFWQNGDYLLWFHGKDLLASWFSQPFIRQFNLGKEAFTNWVLVNEKISWQAYPDLNEFKALCQN